MGSAARVQASAFDSERAAEPAAPALLIVEDDTLMARALRRVVRRHVATFAVVRSDEALALVRSRGLASWVGAIVDVGLPDGSGIDLVRILRREIPGLAVLVITASERRDLACAALELGAHFAFKPMPMAAIESFVAGAIASQAEPRIEAAARALGRARDLTSRERELVTLAARGVSRADLGRQLGVRENTVKSQVRSVLTKCHVETLEALVRAVLRAAVARRD